MNPTSLIAIPDYDKLIIHERHTVYACSLRALAHFTRAGPAKGQAEVNHSLRRITGDEHVLMARAGKVGDRILGQQPFVVGIGGNN